MSTTDRASQILADLKRNAPNIIDERGKLRPVPLHDEQGLPIKPVKP